MLQVGPCTPYSIDRCFLDSLWSILSGGKPSWSCTDGLDMPNFKNVKSTARMRFIFWGNIYFSLDDCTLHLLCCGQVFYLVLSLRMGSELVIKFRRKLYPFAVSKCLHFKSCRIRRIGVKSDFFSLKRFRLWAVCCWKYTYYSKIQWKHLLETQVGQFGVS